MIANAPDDRAERNAGFDIRQAAIARKTFEAMGPARK
jgi:hypothetical protein